MRRSIKIRIAGVLIGTMAVAALSWAGLSGDVFFGTQLRFSDALFPGTEPDADIVVVAVDDESLADVGAWPWSREVHARLIDRLENAGAATVAYDVAFLEPGADPAADQALAQAIARGGNVRLAAIATFDARTPTVDGPPVAAMVQYPIPLLRDAAAGIGTTNVFPDRDGVVRALPAEVGEPSGGSVPSLALSVLGASSAASVATGPGGLMDINYAEGFPVVSAVDVLDGRAPPNLFASKDVLVGVTALGLGDQKLTPLDKANGQPGVIVLANAYNTMKRGAYLTPASNGETFAFVVALAFLVLAAVAFLPLWLSALATALLFATYFAVAFATFDSGTVLNLVYPPLAMVVGFVAGLGLRYFGEMRERRHVTRVFGRYAAPHVVREILAKPEDAVRSLQGETRELSVLFADLRGFTAASEQLAPADVVAALNVYLEAMTTAIQDEDGTIDKFVGDEVMAFWGAPLEQPDHALRAARAALRILELIEDVMMRPPAIDLKVKGAGVGIATGPCLVGNVGSMRRLDYTAIGDTVNTAARLCSSAEPGVIIVTEACAQRLRGSLALGDLPDLIAKGKREPIRIAQVLRPGR